MCDTIYIFTISAAVCLHFYFISFLGSLPTPIEMIIILWVQGLIWKSLKEVFKVGLIDYLLNLWNLADIFSYGSFMGWIGLRTISFLWVWKLRFDGVPDEEIWIPRNQWHPFDPMLLSEGKYSLFQKEMHYFLWQKTFYLFYFDLTCCLVIAHCSMFNLKCEIFMYLLLIGVKNF